MRLLLPLLAFLAGWSTADPGAAPETARGSVFHDLDGDGRRDDGEPGLPGQRVSNGREVATTDVGGRWELPVDGAAELFVIKPRGWMVPLADNATPRHYYLHRPEGSPPSRHLGVAPTGPLPASIDFPLTPQEEPDEFRALFFGDTQPRDRREIGYMDDDVVDECLDFDGEFGVVLGDLVFDGLGLFGDLTDSLSRVGVPWWMVLGNHDQNRDASGDRWANETFARHFGPATYAFDWGPAHFVVLDDVEFYRAEEDGRSVARYRSRLSERVLDFVRNDLAGVPRDRMLVLLTHIPLTAVSNREALFRLIEPYPRSVSVAAHSHTMRVTDLGEQHGWRGAGEHTHVVNVTACGSWWAGEPDDRGVPHATMSDGGPNGWTEWTFSADDWSFVFRAAGEPPERQMSAEPGPAVIGAPVPLTVNVWGGGPRTVVEARWRDGADGATGTNGHDGEGAWITLERRFTADPAYAARRAEEEQRRGDRWRPLPKPSRSHHLWAGELPAPAGAAGPRQLEVRSTDRWGRVSGERLMVAVARAPAPPTPNIVLIMVDDMGYADLGCYGSEVIATPELDQLAAEGMRFTDAYSGSCVCAPARSVLMTGQHAGRTSVRLNTGGTPLRDEDQTLAELLKTAGYVTGGFGKWGLGDLDTSGAAERQGFDEFVGYYHQIHAHSFYPDYLIDGGRKLPLPGNAGFYDAKPPFAGAFPALGPDGQRRQYAHDLIYDRSIDFLRRHAGGEKPFFLYAPWTPPHGRLEIPEDDPAWAQYADEDWPIKARVTAAMVAMIDRQVGELMAELQRLGVADQTLVLFCSDHGADGRFEGVLDSCGPFRGKKRSMYEGGLRVPLIARWPGVVPAGSVSDRPVHFADFLPTLTDLVDLGGAASSAELDGRSFAPTLRGEPQEPPAFLYWEWLRYDWGKRQLAPDGLMQAARIGGWKAVRPRPSAAIELYDLRSDPGETQDLAQDHPERVAEFRALLEEQHRPMRPQAEPDHAPGTSYR